MVVFSFITLIFFSCQNGENSHESDDSIFRLLPARVTNVDFNNELIEGPNLNILMYEYFYNGGGVATGDLNADGFLDLYFVSNMGDNKIYLHTGDENVISYRDISDQTSAKGRSGPWKTGVNIVDVNGDGQLDIHLSYSGTVSDQKRRNQLFINRGIDDAGIPQYEEWAIAYGLAGTAYSNQSYFFDYDRDGDLDVLLLNHNPKNLPILNEAQSKELMNAYDPEKGVQLFQNNNNRFTDVTSQAKINGSELSYGLSIGLSDLNDDGWPDFYVSNDYQVPDFMYINNRDGTFSNNIASLGHISQFSMGNDIADVNGDGLMDILTLDMLPKDIKRQNLLMAPDDYSKFDLNVRSGFHNQFMRNMLHLNNGDGTFSEVGQLSGMSNTDWSWSALLADFDLDGYNDLYVTNGYTRDYTNQDFINYMDNFVQEKGRLERNDVLGIIEHMPSSDVTNRMLKGRSGFEFDDVTVAWGLNQMANSNGAVYADLDNDGDLDLVTNNINQPAFIYENQSNLLTNNYLQIELVGSAANTQAIGAKVTVEVDDTKMHREQYSTRGYLSAVSPILNFGLGDKSIVKTITVEWPTGGKSQLYRQNVNQRIIIKEENKVDDVTDSTVIQQIFAESTPPIDFKDPIRHVRDFDRQRLLLYELSHDGPAMIKGDINGDQKIDIIIGGSQGEPTKVYLQQSSGQFSLIKNVNFDIHAAAHVSALALIDYDLDGDLDLYEGCGGYHNFDPKDPLLRDHLYRNNGKGEFTEVLDALDSMSISTGVVIPIDVNIDGALDLFIGGRMVPNRYPEAAQSQILINDKNGHFVDGGEQYGKDFNQLERVVDAIAADMDADGDQDLVVLDEWSSVFVFTLDGDGFHDNTEKFWSKDMTGLWQSISVGDFNDDQKPDIVLGNFGLNSQLTASKDAPLEMYYDDFDQNGSIDPIVCNYVEGESYPFMTRNDLLAQLGKYRSKFTSYESYSEAQIEQIFTKDELTKAQYLKVTELRSGVLLSPSEGKYQFQALPIEAQFSPIYDIIVYDFNHDQILDLLLTGNNHRTRLRLGQIDANYGQLFLGMGNGSFRYVPQRESGLQIRGDVRSSILINDQILFGINQKALKSYKFN
jgi:enediyne biosynthesis protein E4